VTASADEAMTSSGHGELSAELDQLYARITGAGGKPVQRDEGSRLTHVQNVFRLSSFETDLMLWCAGAELDTRFTPPTFAEALTKLDDTHWDALAPAAPLRYWHLLDVEPGQALVRRPIRIDERVLHHLVGVTFVDSRLDGFVRTESGAAGTLTSAQASVAAALADSLSTPAGRTTVSLVGAAERTQLRVAARAAAAMGLVLIVVPGDRIAPPGHDNADLARMVEREVALLGGLVMVTASETHSGIPAFIEHLGCSAIVTAPGVRADITLTVPVPTSGDQRELWHRVVDEPAPEIDRLAAEFRFEPSDIENIARCSGHRPLFEAARTYARCDLSGLAERVEPCAGWDDLVLPSVAVDTLRELTNHVRLRGQVYDDWGMDGPSARGLGVTALFTGESGTGKTLAAEVIAGELHLDLYRIDLAAVVSKYIGETEKNLKKIFDAADAGSAVLLFDEADAIFGKRSEVRDSHDRYANMEVSYLLARMETYRGLALLTTNLRAAIDRAFLRRLRFVVNFPFPDADARARIWQLMFPPDAPTADLDWRRLAQLHLPGGHIRTVALGAAFLAAAAEQPVSMAHVRTAAQREYTKLERPLTGSEIEGWS
jgi:hypothetical protein